MIGRLNVILFLLALAVALGIKVAVHETEQLSEKSFDAKVTYNLPAGVILVERVKEVEVSLRGRRGDIAGLNPIFLEVFAEIPDGQTGQLEIALDRNNVRVAGDFEVRSIDPNRITVNIEAVETKVLAIDVEAVGEPAAGARVIYLDIKPDWVTVSGPTSQVRSLKSLKAEPISVDRKALSFEGQVSVITPSPLISVQPSRVRVIVTMEAPELSSPLGELSPGSGSS